MRDRLVVVPRWLERNPHRHLLSMERRHQPVEVLEPIGHPKLPTLVVRNEVRQEKLLANPTTSTYVAIAGPSRSESTPPPGAAMYLRDVRIRNFRNLQDLSIELRPGFNALVGRNNTGKSNLFLAIRHALGPAAARGDFLWLTEDDVFADETGRATDPIRIDLSFAELSDVQLAQFFEILDYKPLEPDKSLARIHFEAVWIPKKRRFRVQRWGGADEGERSPIPTEILASIPVTFLPALRDAESALSPGRHSRLARLFEDLAAGDPTAEHERGIRKIFEAANSALEEHPLISDVQASLRSATKDMAGSDFVGISIRAADPEFSRILRMLRVLLDGNPVPELASSGLGYNNLLYIATVLAHLKDAPGDESSILLIEEPEAHLHPQLTERLGHFLAGRLPGASLPQTLVSTHSPTLASNVKPHQVSVLFARNDDARITCNSLHRIGLSAAEERQLQRMLDITRATLYFAKGLILVEGVTEELLIPELALRLGHDLSEHHISVVPLCGVTFDTIAKILGPDAFGIPTAIISDADPPIDRGVTWEEDEPRKAGSSFEISDRAVRLLNSFKDHDTVKVFCSEVTLEYDLAAAGENNPAIMARLWEKNHPGARTFNTRKLEGAGSLEEKALIVWRGICRANHSWSKADFAHVLADWIRTHPNEDFAVPKYIRDAIEHTMSKLQERVMA